MSTTAGVGNPTEDSRSTVGYDSSPSRSVLSGVSRWWRILAIALVVFFVISASIAVFAVRHGYSTQTVVQWFHYDVAAGNSTWNQDFIPQATFCAPDYAHWFGNFSMIWNTSTGQSVTNVLMFTDYPPVPGHPLGVLTGLYWANNTSRGGTSFVSYYPEPCAYTWILAVNSTLPLVVDATMTLTYNVTVISTTMY